MTEKQWISLITKHLVGRTISKVRYMTDKEVEEFGWYGKALVIKLDNGHLLWLSTDDEGNGPGAMYTTFDQLQIIPVIG